MQHLFVLVPFVVGMLVGMLVVVVPAVTTAQPDQSHLVRTVQTLWCHQLAADALAR